MVERITEKCKVTQRERERATHPAAEDWNARWMRERERKDVLRLQRLLFEKSFQVAVVEGRVGGRERRGGEGRRSERVRGKAARIVWYLLLRRKM